MADSRFHEHAPHLTTTQARQAQRGRHVFWVLIASVTLAAIALALAWGFRAGDLHRADASTASRIAASQPLPVTPAPQPATGPGAPVPNDLSR